MRIHFSIVIFILILSSCAKEKKFNDKIDGAWKPKTLKISDNTGIGYYANTLGIVLFAKDAKKSNTGNYKIELNYILNGVHKTFLEEGNYSVKADKIYRNSTTGSENESIIIYINKEDFALEIPNFENKRYQFVLKRE